MIVSVMLEDHGQCLAAGLSDHLGTPVGLDQLLARLREWIVGASPGQGPMSKQFTLGCTARMDPDAPSFR